MDASDQVYRLGKNKALLDANTHWVYQSSYKSKDERVYMKTPFISVSYSRRYFKHLIAIKDYMHNGRTLVDSGTITNIEFKEQLRMVWYPLVLSFTNNYGKDMVPFDIRWAMNDVETYAIGAQSTTWPPKVLDNNGIHIIHVSHNLHNASCSGIENRKLTSSTS